MTENTRSSELEELRKIFAEHWPRGKYDPELLDALLSWHASKVEEALENHKNIMKLADTYTQVKALPQ